MATANGRERRKYYRIPTDQVISFAEVGASERLGSGRDLSRGGIRFDAVGCEIGFGDVLRVTFNLLDRTYVATGRVVWATETDPIAVEIGLEFVEIDPLALRTLEEIEAELEIRADPSPLVAPDGPRARGGRFGS